jgi:polyisoprenoid-binding protein YceI
MMRNVALVLIPLAGLVLAGRVAAQGGAVMAKQGKATFDASNAKIEFVGSKPQGKHDGGFKSFTGTVEVAPTGKSLAKITVDIDTNSLWSDTPKLTGHLKTGDFFDVKRHPKVSFVSTKITDGGKGGATHTITGKLTLHGETKEISIPATVRVAGGAVSVRSNFTIDRTQFGMTYGRGKVDDEVKIAVAIGK